MICFSKLGGDAPEVYSYECRMMVFIEKIKRSKKDGKVDGIKMWIELP